MDERKTAALLALAVLGAGAWWYLRQQQARAAAGDASSDDFGQVSFDLDPATWSFAPIIETATDAVYSVVDTVQNVIAPGTWSPPAAAGPYLPTIYETEDREGIPHNLLARLIYQESRFRADIINGGPNSAGAVGIAQIIPRWHPGVDARDPIASIKYAGHFLAQLRQQFGSWALALAAYNWGPGSLSKNGFAAAPLETRNYVAQITGAVPVV